MKCLSKHFFSWRFMKRLVKMLFAILFFLIVVAIGFVFAKGYIEYKEIISELSVEQACLQIESKDTFVSYEYLPKTLLEATVAIEDQRFYEHKGLDYLATARAVVSQLVPGMPKSGGSTISSQTVKNLYGLFESSLDRKIVELFLTRDLESIRTKDQILDLYVNIINYGDGHIGIYEASMGYFGILPIYLNDDQCTLLAGIPQSPSNYQLSDHEHNARIRQQQVLKAMQ